jgi:XTP/dITP diphosphohydrolase
VNAYKKGYYCAKKSGLMTLADDSGIIIDALKNELGVKTRRWGAGENATDQEWIDYFLKRMENEENRRTTFVSCLCLVNEEGNILKLGKGEIKGIITKNLEAPILPGIPLSSCFLPENHTKVHSALTIEEKNKISHRGKAMIKIREYLAHNFLNH